MSYSNSDDEMEMDFLRERYSSHRKYDVFFSFRGEDTRASFISHLYNSLLNAGITVFKDDESLPRGNHISPSLRLAIEESQISVVVFSRNYADSRWCLRELEKIMECHRTIGQVVVPVFYDVDPSEVRHQTGEFGKGFENLEKKMLKEEEEKEMGWWIKLFEAAGIPRVVELNTRSGEMEIADEIDLLVKSWRVALREAAGLSSFEILNYSREIGIANLIDQLVKDWREVLGEAAGISRVEGQTYSREMEIANKIDLLVKSWREAIYEAAGTSRAEVLNCRKQDLEIGFMIDQRVKSWSKELRQTTGVISQPVVLNANQKLMEIANEIDLRVKYWKETLSETIGGISWPIVPNTNGDMEISNQIELRVQYWREVLREFTGGPSRAVVLTTRSGKVEIAYEIDLFLDRWTEALRDAARIPKPVVLDTNGELRETANKIHLLVKPWRDALREAAGIAGIVVLHSRNESEVIKNIVENVTHLLDKTELFIADNPVGVESRVEDIIQLLDLKLSNDVVLLGIWGMGGIGKTTIAKSIYNKIGRNFEGRSFLAHIREVWGKDAGQIHLQEQLLLDIDKETKTKIRNVESGKNILKERLRRKRVLLVLDDVNKVHQLNALCASREWVGSGSRIIITTRDMHILRGRRVDKVYTMKVMDEGESIALFSWHAFKQESPKEDFAELSRNVTAYSGGLPLALEVLGSYLFDMEVTEWTNVLEKLKKIPNDEVQEKLKISFDGLSDDTEKEIFLDIACFFIGMDRNDVINILNGAGLCAENGIRVLVERSLVTVDYKNKLGMHDLLRDMGREIIRSKSPMEPEERSRLWFDEDVLDVLLKETGTKAIEGLTLKLPRTDAKCLCTKAFKKMKKLRLLQLSGVQLIGDFEYLSKDLRWLYWNGFPLTCMPANFYQGSLVSIELENSKITLLWKETQVMEKLKILNLSHSHYLIHTPDFSNLPFLEKLILIDCPRLSEVSYSIGRLNKILLINFQDCISLRNLPRSIYKLKSLKTLILSGCLKIEKLEEDLEQMESLTILVADKTGITRVPFSIVRSKSIGYISLCGYEGFSRDVFPSIIWSWMSPSNSLSSRVGTFAGMSSLVSLEVPNSNFHHMSYISKDLPKLQRLWVKCDSELQLSRDATSILDVLHVTNFEEFESTAATLQMPNTNAFTLIKCNCQVHISGSETSLRSLLIQMGMSCQVTNILKESILQNITSGDGDCCLLPHDSYPYCLSFNSEGSSVIFEIPQGDGRNLKKMMCHVQYSSPDNITSDGLKNLLLINHTKATIQLYKRDALASIEAEEWQRVLSNNEPGNKVQIVVVFSSRLIVNKTTIYLIYEPMDEKMEPSHVNNNIISSSGDGNVFAVRSFSPLLESIYEPMDEKMEQCQAPNKNVIVSSCDENLCDVRSTSLQVESFDELGSSSIKSSIKHLWTKCLPCKYICKVKLEKKKNQG